MTRGFHVAIAALERKIAELQCQQFSPMENLLPHFAKATTYLTISPYLFLGQTTNPKFHSLKRDAIFAREIRNRKAQGKSRKSTASPSRATGRSRRIEELSPAEYNETKTDTIDQLKELNTSLTKLVNGDISLVSELGAMQLATQAAISQAFKTPEVIKLFGKKEPLQLRERLQMIEQNFKLTKLNQKGYDQQKAEILVALRQLGEQLTTDELQFLERHNNVSNAFKNVEFVEVND
ncbi:protein LZIC-like isoform X1 [Photinus pyralis]|uniref:protein LZIC-like isoform X1 n=1 Tax=Photinus pyralis TaxID=7054 RepID=UPI00126705B6|nr:protein LZIC-like isoform X1 [Photinus pyralis]